MIVQFLAINVIIIFVTIYYPFKNHNKILNKSGKEQVSIYEFLNKTKEPLKPKTILIGLIFGFIFGFIDNVGLLFGLGSFGDYLPGGLVVKSTLGNTYSDGLGALIGSGLSVVAKDHYNYEQDKEPVWVNFVGVVIGCLFGVAFSIFWGKFIQGKPLNQI